MTSFVVRTKNLVSSTKLSAFDGLKRQEVVGTGLRTSDEWRGGEGRRMKQHSNATIKRAKNSTTVQNLTYRINSSAIFLQKTLKGTFSVRVSSQPTKESGRKG